MNTDRVHRAPRYQTLAELLEALGGISPSRVRADPPPGRATEKHLTRLNDRKEGIYELVDGTLVEKVGSFIKGFVACKLIGKVGTYLDERDLGILSGARGSMRLAPGLVRGPDVAFVSWNQLPGRLLPREPIPDLYPELAVELPGAGNTQAEMQRKLSDFFRAGTRLVWLLYIERRVVEVYTAPDQHTLVTEEQTLDGGDVLPGLSVPLRHLFARVPSPKQRGKGRAGQKRPRKQGRSPQD